MRSILLPDKSKWTIAPLSVLFAFLDKTGSKSNFQSFSFNQNITKQELFYQVVKIYFYKNCIIDKSHIDQYDVIQFDQNLVLHIAFFTEDLKLESKFLIFDGKRKIYLPILSSQVLTPIRSRKSLHSLAIAPNC